MSETIKPSDYFTLDPQRENHEKFLRGRGQTLTEALQSIIAPGQNVSFHGEPGVGKTSIARALYRISLGQQGLAEELGVEVPDYHEPLPCLWFECMESDSSLEDVLGRLISESYAYLESVFPKTLLARDYRSVISQQGTAIAFNYFTEGLKRDYPDLQLLVFLDDVDRLKATPSVGSILKLRRNVSFVLSGVSTGLKDLISDYQPNTKHFDQFTIDLLPKEEAFGLFSAASTRSLGKVSYSQDFLDLVWKLSWGHPLILQHFGYFSLAPKSLKLDQPIGKDGLKGGASRLLKKEQAAHLKEETDGYPIRKQVLAYLASLPYEYVLSDDIASADSLPDGVVGILDDLSGKDAPILHRKGRRYRFVDSYYRAAAALMFDASLWD